MRRIITTIIITITCITACSPFSKISPTADKNVSIPATDLQRPIPSASPETSQEPVLPTSKPSTTPAATVQALFARPELAVISIDNAFQVKQLYTLKGHTNQVADVAFSPDGSYIASAGLDQTVRLWDAKTGQELTKIRVAGADLNSIAFSPDGHYLAYAEAIYDLKSTQVAQVLEQENPSGGRVAFSPDNKLLAVVLYDQPIHIWDVASGTLLKTIEEPDKNFDNSTFAVAFSPDGSTLATSGHQGSVRFWDVASGQMIGALNYSARDVHDIDYSSDGKLLATISIDGSTRIWDVATGENIQTMLQGGGLYGVAFSNDSTIVACAGTDRTVKLWDVENGSQIVSLPHRDEVMAVAFSPDGKLIATADYAKNINLWGVPE